MMVAVIVNSRGIVAVMMIMRVIAMVMMVIVTVFIVTVSMRMAVIMRFVVVHSCSLLS